MNIPKIVTFKIVKQNLVYKIVVHGVVFKKSFFSYDSAMSHIGTLSEYFGDNTSFVKC